MPNRILKESICTSENIDKLSAFNETVFYRLIVNCDDFGRLDARPKILASRLFPLKDIRAAQIENALRALTSAELVTLYTVNGKPFLQMNTWDRHQQIRAAKSKFPGPEEGMISVDINCNQAQSDDIKCNQAQSNVPVIQSNPNPNPNPNTKSEGAKIAHEAVLKKWNSLDLGTVRGLSGTREQHLDARIRENGLDTVIEAIDRIRLSDFLYGNNPKGWKITFDWFLNPTNFQKVLEGNYDRKEPPKQKADLRDVQSMLNRMEKTL